MDLEQLKADIQAYATEIGIQKIGFTTADPFLFLKERLEIAEKEDVLTGFEHPVLEERVYPDRIFNEPKSIIAIALSYPSKLKMSPVSRKEARRGVFARASWGIDYHTILREKLALLEAFIKERVPDAVMKSMVDTGELSDVAVAERAGIGARGKNTLLITKEYGSWVYLGEMITNLAFPPDEPIGDLCGDCNQCVKACPTGSLLGEGKMNPKICLSYLTQTKDFLEEEYREVLHNRLYGCDTCQVVCPYNRGKDFHFHEAMEPDPELVRPELKPLLKISNREFKEKFGDMAGSWRGKKPIQRNAIIVLARYKDKTAIEPLIDCLTNDPRPVIRGTSAWALAKIGGEKAEQAIHKALTVEEEEEVLMELENAKKIIETK
ncbi:tRNA epoxyqueuosine(34) reductase QueG [Listeria kieliensis]|uniref:Iron-sulfur cluster-binding protein n=1 Tax=Listeria kieliensis TaxID=1621700 RepID=A0A3D8TTP9_9LIST|nr:tRNA epoxyqueuosine(34) reductase QueG [Listeria kieliensis]RDX02212.1 iron-sulfur cluster-binding protein [Listeria kieliensis]